MCTLLHSKAHTWQFGGGGKGVDSMCAESAYCTCLKKGLKGGEGLSRNNPKFGIWECPLDSQVFLFTSVFSMCSPALMRCSQKSIFRWALHYEDTQVLFASESWDVHVFLCIGSTKQEKRDLGRFPTASEKGTLPFWKWHQFIRNSNLGRIATEGEFEHRPLSGTWQAAMPSWHHGGLTHLFLLKANVMDEVCNGTLASGEAARTRRL